MASDKLLQALMYQNIFQQQPPAQNMGQAVGQGFSALATALAMRQMHKGFQEQDRLQEQDDGQRLTHAVAMAQGTKAGYDPKTRIDWNQERKPDLFGAGIHLMGSGNEAHQRLGQSFVTQHLTPKRPIKMGKDDRLFDPETHEEIIGASGGPDERTKGVAVDGKLVDPYTREVICGGSDGVDPGKIASGEDALRKEMLSQSSGFDEVRRSVINMQQYAQDATGASDVALVFSFFKTIDPTSTVREGEYATAASAAGLSQRLVQAFRRVDGGEILPPDLRQELLAVGQQNYSQWLTDQQRREAYYGVLATQRGLDPSRSVQSLIREVPGAGPAATGSTGYAPPTSGRAPPPSAARDSSRADELCREFGSLDRALIAYDWGPQNVKDWIAAGADPATVPSETRKYIARIKGDLGMQSGPASTAGSAQPTGGTPVPSLREQLPGLEARVGNVQALGGGTQSDTLASGSRDDIFRDLGEVKRAAGIMIDRGVTREQIIEYIEAEGYTAQQVRNYQIEGPLARCPSTSLSTSGAVRPLGFGPWSAAWRTRKTVWPRSASGIPTLSPTTTTTPSSPIPTQVARRSTTRRASSWIWAISPA